MKFVLLILCLLNFGITSAFASLIDNNSYTSDAVSGLDWLDVTETVGLSAREVYAQMEVGGDYEGWHYATGDELNTLIFNYTGSMTNLNSQTDQPDHQIDGLISLLGATETLTSDSGLSVFNFLSGMLYDFEFAPPICTVSPSGDLECISHANVWVGVMAHFYIDPGDALLFPELPSTLIDFSETHRLLLEPDTSKSDTGSFLVRNTSSSSGSSPRVPEPSVIWLLGIGFFTVFSRSSLKI